MTESRRKGIILAGGLGTRLHPLTRVTSKQLLPVYDKPMIYYSLSTLLLAGVREIVLISSPEALPQFKTLLGDGSDWGVKLVFVEQAHPNGLAEALILAEPHTAGHPTVMILGDNIFFGNGLTKFLRDADATDTGATIFCYRVKNPRQYGVVNVDASGTPTELVEKPENPQSNLAITGLYFYDEMAPALAKKVTPSARGELEITSVNQMYLEMGKLSLKTLYRGFAWFDAGTVDDLMDASDFIRHIERRQDIKISCPEEIVFRNGWIDRDGLGALAARFKPGTYGNYLRMILADDALYRTGPNG